MRQDNKWWSSLFQYCVTNPEVDRHRKNTAFEMDCQCNLLCMIRKIFWDTFGWTYKPVVITQVTMVMVLTMIWWKWHEERTKTQTLIQKRGDHQSPISLTSSSTPEQITESLLNISVSLQRIEPAIHAQYIRLIRLKCCAVKEPGKHTAYCLGASLFECTYWMLM